MAEGNDELDALRERAYGPRADIHLDAGALRRLRELEGEGRRRPAPAREAPPELVAVPEVRPEPVGAEEPEPEHPLLPLLRLLAGRLSRVRRSTVLIVLGAVAFAAALTTALVLVERVQTDPLQTGAVQIARLSVDDGYEVPDFFGGQGRGVSLEGFEEFHGLRAIVGPGGYLSRGFDDVCLTIYSSENAAASTDGSFSGPLLGGCVVGEFPAMTQFYSDIDGLSEELRSAFPDSTAFQFVYDAAHNEVVVFTSE